MCFSSFLTCTVRQCLKLGPITMSFSSFLVTFYCHCGNDVPKLSLHFMSYPVCERPLFPIRIWSTFSRTQLNSVNLNLHTIHYVTWNEMIIFKDLSLQFVKILLISLSNIIKTKSFVILSWFTKQVLIHVKWNSNKLPLFILYDKKHIFFSSNLACVKELLAAHGNNNNSFHTELYVTKIGCKFITEMSFFCAKKKLFV